MLEFPSIKPKAGDVLVASREDSWGHVAEYRGDIEADDDTVRIEFGEREELPFGRDTFEATVNGNETGIHIDLVTEVFGLADSLEYQR